MGRKRKIVVGETDKNSLQVTISGTKFEISTDSDVYEIAESYGIPEEDIWDAITVYYSKGTGCEGCANLGLSGMFPCNTCSRNPGIKDYYKARK